MLILMEGDRYVNYFLIKPSFDADGQVYRTYVNNSNNLNIYTGSLC